MGGGTDAISGRSFNNCVSGKQIVDMISIKLDIQRKPALEIGRVLQEQFDLLTTKIFFMIFSNLFLQRIYKARLFQLSPCRQRKSVLLLLGTC